MADITYTTRLQFRSVYDLSVLHRAPLLVDDADDCLLILRSALGIAVGEAAGDLVKPVGAKAVAYNVRRLLRSGVRKFITQLLRKILGPIARKITEKALMRILVPGINIPLSSALNHAFTKKMLQRAERAMRRRGAIIQPILRLHAAEREPVDTPGIACQSGHVSSFPRDLLIKALIGVMEAPARDGWDEDQMNALRYTQNALSLSDEECGALEDWFDRKCPEIAASMPALGDKGGRAFVDFLVAAAAAGDGSQHDEAYLRAINTFGTTLAITVTEEDLNAARSALG
jgi:hypothetical protein